MTAAMGGLLLLAGCGADGDAAEAEPAPTVTVTETAKPETAAELDEQTQLALSAFHVTGGVRGLQALLSANRVDCPNTEPEESQITGEDSYYLYCDPLEETMLWFAEFDRLTDSTVHETFAPGIEDGRGVVYTSRFAVLSDDQEILEDSLEALSPFDPEMIDPS